MYQGIYKPYDNTEIDYTYSPGEPQTWDDPGCPPEIEFGDMRINGEPAGIDLEEVLFEHCGDDWEEKLLAEIDQAKARKEEERAEYLYEQHQDRLMEVRI